MVQIKAHIFLSGRQGAEQETDLIHLFLEKFNDIKMRQS